VVSATGCRVVGPVLTPADRSGAARVRVGIRSRVTATATLIVAVTLVLGAALVTLLLQQSLVAGVDASAGARARDVAALAAAASLPTTIQTTGEETALVQVVDASNRVVAASANIEGQGPIVPTPSAAARGPVTTPLTPLGEHPFRVVVEPWPKGRGWVVVATALTQVDSAVLSLIGLFAVIIPAILVIVALALWRAVGQVLRPVEAIRERAAGISAANLSQRIPVPPTSDELARLAVTMNEMLDRLDAASLRQRQFIGDAAHELRSPLAALRAQLDVALAHPEDPASVGTIARVSEQAARMSTLVDDLLFLARSSEPAPATSAGPVDLDELVVDEVRRMRQFAGPQVDLVGLSAARLRGSARDLGRMLRNLGDNALEHATSRVQVRLSVDHMAELAVTDDGPGIPQADRVRVFERFTRLDDSRARRAGGGGAGIGLSIVKQIVLAHGGIVEVRDRGDGQSGAVLVVRLPLLEPGDNT
jgi:signal transduction histidine kinase